jgi:hypothetical protein
VSREYYNPSDDAAVIANAVNRLTDVLAEIRDAMLRLEQTTEQPVRTVKREERM